MRALWLGTEKNRTERRQRRAVIGTARRSGLFAAIRIGAALVLQGSRRTREATGNGGIAPGDDGAAMGSVRVKERCRGTPPVSVEVRRRPGGGIGPSLFAGAAHGADNGIGPSGQDVVSTGRPGTSVAAFPVFAYEANRVPDDAFPAAARAAVFEADAPPCRASTSASVHDPG